MNDMISSLPDEILCRILSCLPTEDVYATTVLSKRWTALCILVQTIDIDDSRFNKSGRHKSNFLKMIYAILAQTSAQKCIRKICIKWYSSNIFYEWERHSLLEKSLTAAAEHGMEHLDLYVGMNYSPYYILSFKTLVVLKLKHMSFDDIHTTVNLVSLKILHLFKVKFMVIFDLEKFLNGCPILEDFEAKDVTYLFEADAKLKALPNLVRANINNLGPYYDFPPLVTFSNVVFLRSEEVFADFVVFCNLTHLELFFDNVDTECWSMVSGMLNSCPNLQSFLLDKPKKVLGTLFWSEYVEPCFVPPCFSSQLRKCSITNYNKYDLGFVKYIMQNSTSLMSITLQNPPSMDPFKKLDRLNELFSCVDSSLTFKIIFR